MSFSAIRIRKSADLIPDVYKCLFGKGGVAIFLILMGGGSCNFIIYSRNRGGGNIFFLTPRRCLPPPPSAEIYEQSLNSWSIAHRAGEIARCRLQFESVLSIKCSCNGTMQAWRALARGTSHTIIPSVVDNKIFDGNGPLWFWCKKLVPVTRWMLKFIPKTCSLFQITYDPWWPFEEAVPDRKRGKDLPGTQLSPIMPYNVNGQRRRRYILCHDILI